MFITFNAIPNGGQLKVDQSLSFIGWHIRQGYYFRDSFPLFCTVIRIHKDNLLLINLHPLITYNNKLLLAKNSEFT